MEYIWKYFLDLNRKRQGNGYGPNPIPYSEILAYFSVYRIDYDELELSLIDILDTVAMDYFSEQAEKEANKNKKKK